MKRLDNMSLAEIARRMYQGMKSQDWEQSVRSNGSCAYRGVGGNKCVVGHCISDARAELWDKGFNGDGELTSITKWSTTLPNLNPDTLTFLCRAQGIHDTIDCIHSEGTLSSKLEELFHQHDISPEEYNP